MNEATVYLSTFTFLAFQLNSAIDKGSYDALTIDEVKDAVENGTVFSFLQDRLGRDLDISIVSQDDRQTLVAEWQDMLGAINERRKMGVEYRGLTLLVAYLLEGIQRRW